MYTGLYAAVSGSIAQEKQLEILSNNLSNSSTVGFKADKPLFHLVESTIIVGEVIVDEKFPAVVTSLDPLQGRHSLQQQLLTTYTDFSQGKIRQTGNPLDLALEGSGFFVVNMQEGAAYTRQGTLSINAQGVLTTQDGFEVQGQGGPIDVQGGRIEIDATGEVRVDGTIRGRLKLVDFQQPYQLEKTGHTLFRPSSDNAQEVAAVDLSIHQGALEGSNSQPIRLLGQTLQTSRAYEAYQKVIQAFDETAGRAVNDIARTN